MKFLLTSGGISNISIENELKRLIGKNNFNNLKVLFCTTASNYEGGNMNDWLIKDLIYRGKSNGVKGLKALNHTQLKKLIPNITDNITCGLFAENAYIINPYLLTICLAEEGVVNGGQVDLDFDTLKIINKGY